MFDGCMPRRSSERSQSDRDSMASAKLTKVAMAAARKPPVVRSLTASRRTISVQLDTLIRATRAVGRNVEIRIKRSARRD